MKKSAPRQIQPIGQVDATLALPGSKSITNRALLLAALAQQPGRVNSPLRSDDSLAFVEALNQMGASLRWDGEDVVIDRPLPTGRRGSVDCHDAGTAARFLPPAAVALGSEIRFDASDQMRARPMADLFNALRQLGARTQPETGIHLPVKVSSNGLNGGEIELDGKVSSQFLTGLLMAAPLAKSPLTIRSNGLISRPYIDLTIAMMEQFGRSVERTDYSEFRVSDLGAYRRAEPYGVEADASTASYFFAMAAATGSKVRVTNIRRSSLQGDIKFLDALEQMGATVRDDSRGISVQGPQRLRGIDIDMSDISDVMMTLAAIAPLADGPTRIVNVGQARVKESDRIAAMVEGLNRLGIQTEDGPDWLTVHPGTIRPASIDTKRDHRIAMSFSVLGMAQPGVTIEDPNCVSKTCPNFFELSADVASRTVPSGPQLG